MEVWIMPANEVSMTSGGTMLEQAIRADDSENLADAGPADIGRADVNLKMTETSQKVQ